MMTGLGVEVLAVGLKSRLPISLKFLFTEEGDKTTFQESPLPTVDHLHQGDPRWLLK